MKKLKNTVTIILTLVMVLSMFAGCAGNTSETTIATTKSTTATTAKETTKSETTAETTVAAMYKEAPEFVDLVAASTLPVVEDRLPDFPFVCTTENIGTYGGTLNTACTSALSLHVRAAVTGDHYENFLAWNEDNSERIGYLAEEYSIDATYTEFSFMIRRGVKWSDGEPFTTEDVKFWWNDYMLNEDLSAGVPGFLKDPVTGNVAELIVDDGYSFTIKFENPNQNFFDNLFTGWNYMYLPSKYLSKYNINYSDVETLNAQAKDAGFDSWITYFKNRMDENANIERPVLTAFVLQNSWDGATRVTYKRNPYYWKVDSEGNQLPYLDEIVIDIAGDDSVVKLNTLNGDYNFMGFPVCQFTADIALFKENETKGDYSLKLEGSTEPNILNIYFNFHSTNTTLQKIFSQKEFRFAMSYAINRQNIIDTFVNIGPIQMKPSQVTVLETSVLYTEKAGVLGQTAVDYNVSKANELLDAIGLAGRDTDGYRTAEDGSTVGFVMLVPTWVKNQVDIAERICEQWQEVGIKATVQALDPSVWGEKLNLNEYDVTAINSYGGFISYAADDIGHYGFLNNTGWGSMFEAKQYALWGDTNGAEGVEPPADIKALQTLGKKLQVTANIADRKMILDEMLGYWIDNLYVLGICAKPPYFYLVGNDLKNVSKYIASPWIYGCWCAYDGPWQYYISE